MYDFLNAQVAPQPFLQNSLNHSVSSQTELRTVAKNLRIPLGHGGASVDQVSETPRSTRGCSGAPNHRTPCPQEPLGLQFLHGHTRSYMRDARHLSGLRLPAPSSGKPSLVTLLCCSPLCLFILASLLPHPRVRKGLAMVATEWGRGGKQSQHGSG